MRTHMEFLNEDGLVDQMLGWVFIDWADVDARGVCAAYNAIFAGACDAAEGIAALKGDKWSEAIYSNAASGVRKAFSSAFISFSQVLLSRFFIGPS